MSTPNRIVLLIAVALGSVTTLAGCTLVPHVYACPAIGYINTATLEVQGTQPLALKVCAGQECAASTDARLSALLSVSAGTPGRWTVTTGSTSPRQLAVTSLDAAGSPVAKATATLSWKRVGGSTYCGGPLAAHATLDFS